jgi:MFS family permease
MTGSIRTKAMAMGEFRSHWLLLVSAFLGSTLPSTLAFSTGVFTAAWQEKFGWQRGEIGAALGILHVAVIIMSPLMGRMIDRYGVRRPTLWCLGLLPAVFVAMSRVGPQLWTLYAVYFLFGVLASGTGFVSYTRAVGEYFHKKRGLALSIACSSTTLVAAVMPVVANEFIKIFGVRNAWLGFAMLVVLIWPVVYLGLKDVETSAGSTLLGRSNSLEAVVGFRVIAKDRNFWFLASACLLMIFVASGLQVQTVPFLRSIGFSQDRAVASASSLAIGLGVSRLATGFFLDWIFAPTVFKAFCLVGIAGCASLLSGQGVLIVLGVAAIGAVMGAEGDLMSYATSRYFGLLNYAKTFGLLYGISAFGSMLAPVINGYIYDREGSYTYTIGFAIFALSVAALLIHQLPRYPGHAALQIGGARPARAMESEAR